MTIRSFTKMHGLGNDFVVLDARVAPIHLSANQARAIADRRTGIGCDQIITLKPSDKADLFMRIQNSDGSEAEACGNAARCVALLTIRENDSDGAFLETAVNTLHATTTSDGLIAIDMGIPRFSWQDIPLATPEDTLHVKLVRGSLSDPAAVNLGNPHVVFFVDDVSSVPIERLGPSLETDPIFPKHANIGVASIIDPRGKIRLRVWERGAGLTLACGTGACAALVAAHRRGICDREAEVLLDGGKLYIRWQENDHVIMTGPATITFVGEIEASLLT